MAKRPTEHQSEYERQRALIAKFSNSKLKKEQKISADAVAAEPYWTQESERLRVLDEEIDRRTNLTYWVMAMRGHTAAGSFSHVSNGDKLHESEEACQHEIDTMEGWIGMGDRKRYYPLPLKFHRPL
jgi:hypothetical protein